MNDPYNILGISRGASIDEIKKAYRTLSKKYHPDMPGGDESKFNEIRDAYELIINPNKFNKSRSYSANTDFEDILKDVWKKTWGSGFGGDFNERYSYNRRGFDINHIVNLTLNEAYYGCKRVIQIGMKKISVNISSGVTPGQKLRIKGYGQRGFTEENNGDLIITINIFSDGRYKLTENGLGVNLDVDAFTAMIGGEANIDVFGKSILVNVPKCIQHNSTIISEDNGWPIYKKNKKTDLIIRVNIIIPKIDSRQENLIKMAINTK